MFPTRKEVLIHGHMPKVIIPVVWISSICYLGDMHGGTALGIPVFMGSLFGIPLLMLYMVRIGEYTATQSLIKGLDYAKRRGDFHYGEYNFNQTARDFILGWRESNSKAYLR